MMTLPAELLIAGSLVSFALLNAPIAKLKELKDEHSQHDRRSTSASLWAMCCRSGH
jgi:hypothetical protein